MGMIASMKSRVGKMPSALNTGRTKNGFSLLNRVFTPIEAKTGKLKNRKCEMGTNEDSFGYRCLEAPDERRSADSG